MKRKVPRLRSDEEAEAFLEQDLSNLDFSQFKPMRFEFEAKAGRINMRLPESLVKTLKERARKRGIPYQRFTREMIELGLSASTKRRPTSR
jgi:predicted DNA binding CopG/RHH family protein